MKKLGYCLLFISGAALLTSGCTTIKNKLADASMMKKQLANGSQVQIGTNVPPTANWGCKEVDMPLYMNWAKLKSQAAFSFDSGYNILMTKAIDYANLQNLRINYINLHIPEEKSFSAGSGSFSTVYDLRRGSQASASFYMCSVINPDRKIGYTTSTQMGYSIN